MALEAQDNPFTSILMVGAADPEALSGDADPSAGSYRLVMGTDDKLYILDEAGVATEVGAAAGGVATDAIWDAAGDLAQGTGANTGAKLGAGTAGQFLKSGGAATANAWASRELDYVAITGNVNLTATSEATANTIVTGNAVAYDGSTIVVIEFFSRTVVMPAAAQAIVDLVLYDGSSSIGLFGRLRASNVATGAEQHSVFLQARITPSAATHTYSIRGYVNTGTAVVGAGAGGSGVSVPAFIRIQRAV